MHGLNITYPYKQIAVAKVEVEDPLVRRLGAINTVVFGSDGARGYNTDHSGFIAAYRATFGSGRTRAHCDHGCGRGWKCGGFRPDCAWLRRTDDRRQGCCEGRGSGAGSRRYSCQSCHSQKCRWRRAGCRRHRQLHASWNGWSSWVADRRLVFRASALGVRGNLYTKAD